VEVSRRTFVRTVAAAGTAAWASPAFGVEQRMRDGLGEDRVRDVVPGQRLRSRLLNDRFPDLARHFIFEYYPWYAPDAHWSQWDRQPPVDVASNYMPRLGAYDSGDVKVLEQHARWIAGAGAGAINLSWWGPRDRTDRVIPTLMDVMRAHGIHVTFHLEPYSLRRGLDYARDIQYLIREYGDSRRWDCFLLLQHEDGCDPQ
jgi:hypothetical protein